VSERRDRIIRLLEAHQQEHGLPLKAFQRHSQEVWADALAPQGIAPLLASDPTNSERQTVILIQDEIPGPETDAQIISATREHDVACSLSVNLKLELSEGITNSVSSPAGSAMNIYWEKKHVEALEERYAGTAFGKDSIPEVPKTVTTTPKAELAAAIASGNAALILGAGVSIIASGEGARWESLIQGGLSYIDNPDVRHDQWVTSPESGAEKLYEALREKGVFEHYLRDVLGNLSIRSTELVRALDAASIPILTLNQDTIIEATTRRKALTWNSESLGAGAPWHRGGPKKLALRRLRCRR